MNTYSVEKLCNGMYRIQSKSSGLVGLYDWNGARRSGDLPLKNAVKVIADAIRNGSVIR